MRRALACPSREPYPVPRSVSLRFPDRLEKFSDATLRGCSCGAPYLTQDALLKGSRVRHGVPGDTNVTNVTSDPGHCGVHVCPT